MSEISLTGQLSNWLSEIAVWTMRHVTTVPALAQVAALILIFILSYICHHKLRPLLDSWLKKSDLPALIQSAGVVIARETGGLIFLTLAWITAGVFEKSPTIGSADLLEIFASLATAWVIITISSSIIANKALARVVAVAAWTIAALNILGLLAPTMDTLREFTFSFGSATVSLLDVVGGIALLIFLIWVALAVSRAIERSIIGVQGITPRGRVLIIKLSRGALIALAVLVALPTMGVNFGALAVFGGALGVGIGIGLQKQVSNLLSGLFLLLDKSIKPGDVIEVGETFGWVKQMTARYVGVVTRDNKEILIPNDDFVVNQVINWSHSDRIVRMEVSFGVAYASDPHEIRRLAVEAAKTPKRIARDPEPVCHLAEFGDSSLNFVLRFWIVDPEEGVTNIKGQVLLALWDTFKDHKIEIPYPHRQLLLDPTTLSSLNKTS